MTEKQKLSRLLISSQQLVRRLQKSGESYTTIEKGTGLNRSQLSLVASGQRGLGEDPYRRLLKYALDCEVVKI